MQEATSLPFQVQPHDALRQGLVTLKDGAAAAHPVETIQKMAGPAAEAARYDMLRNLYGTALPARMQIERQILDRQALWQHGGGSGCFAGANVTCGIEELQAITATWGWETCLSTLNCLPAAPASRTLAQATWACCGRAGWGGCRCSLLCASLCPLNVPGFL